MKHFMQPRNPILRETQPPETTSSSNPNNSAKPRSVRKQKPSKENAPPPDLNSMPDFSNSPAKKLLKSPLPPRPPNPLKRKLVQGGVDEGGVSGVSDSGVKVIVRMRPPSKDEEEGEMVVQKTSGDSLAIAGQTFTFDSVADNQSTQLDIFQLVGAPLVENCLAGFNSSVFAYGQTGSGKTYTIWGPANALLEENLSSDQQGLTPRIFERLFSRIEEEQNKHTDKQLRYQCRCSFLEIYNEQITDLLDPSQSNLQIREDVKTGVYVENLREECVCTMKDVTQFLMKGLANRRTGATSINSESSRSHSVFTCVVESRCKSMADGLSCFKLSKLNLVDLAGSERQKLTGAAGQRLKEAGNINRSLSQLGNLINILAEVSQTGKQRHIPYRDSKLTFLLQESLGGNAKLAMVCAISPAQSCKSETFSTIRFAQRAKAIKNKAVVNEEVQDDVVILREVIRQLKDELFRIKQKGTQTEPKGGYSTGWNARRSLNLLKFSLNHPITMSHVDADSDEEMEIVDQAEQIGLLLASIEGNNTLDAKKLEGMQFVDSKLLASRKGLQNASERMSTEEHLNFPLMGSVENIDPKQGSEDNDVNMDEEISEQVEMHAIIPFCGETLGISAPSCLKTEIHNCNEGISAIENLSNSVESFERNNSSHPNPYHLPPTVSNFRNETSLAPVMEIPSCATSQISLDDAREKPYPSSRSSVFEYPSKICIVEREVSPVLKSPTPTVSPIPCNSSRKSLRTSSTLTASQKDLKDSNLSPETIHLSFAESSKSAFLNTQSTQTSKNYNRPSEHLAASLQRGHDILDSRQTTGLRRSSFRFSYKPSDIKPSLQQVHKVGIKPSLQQQVHKVDVGVQTILQDELAEGVPTVFLCSKCNSRDTQEPKDANVTANLQLVTVDDGSQSAEKLMKHVPKAVKKVLTGAIRREMAMEEYCAKKILEIKQLNRLVQQYKHERECNTIIGQMQEDKIVRLESVMDGVLSTEDFMEDELVSLKEENKILKDKYENHPELLSTEIELKRVQDDLECYQNFHDMGERDVLIEEIQDLRTQLQYYTDAAPKSGKRKYSLLQLTNSCEPSLMVPSLCSIPESTGESGEQKIETRRNLWAEAESKWISLAEELRAELEATRALAEKQREELDMEKKCSEELKVSMQMAMQGHARMIEQYADLQEKHIQLLDRNRQIQDGIDDVKKAAAKAGVKRAESKFINTLAEEISALKVAREKERRYLMDENKGLQAQLRDTAEALQAAGELLVRLKEAEEAVTTAQNQAAEAVEETEKAYKQIDQLKWMHEKEVSSLNQLLTKYHTVKAAGPVYDTVKAAGPVYDTVKEVAPVYDTDMAKYDAVELDTDMTKYDAVELDPTDQQWRDEFDTVYSAEEESNKLLGPSSWFSGYDRCNI